jgi:hypothetical protein
MNPYLSELVAAARVDIAGATVAAGYFARGCVAALPGGAGTGIYTITLDRALAPDARVIHVEAEAADVSHRVDAASNTVITVTFRTVAAAPAAVDSAFKISVWRAAGGGGTTGR